MLINIHTSLWLLTLYLLPVEITVSAVSSPEKTLSAWLASITSFFQVLANKHLSAESLNILAPAPHAHLLGIMSLLRVCHSPDTGLEEEPILLSTLCTTCLGQIYI